jgi:crotonobetainyl-CoA:carnitine CoA-transferase CaiB-like acyl-CoA transferase
MTIGSETHWQMVCSVIEKPEWIDDPELQDWRGRTARADEIRTAIQSWCSSRDKMEIFHSFQTVRMAVAPGYGLGEILSDPVKKLLEPAPAAAGGPA